MALTEKQLKLMSGVVYKKMTEKGLANKLFALPIEKQAQKLYDTLKIIKISVGEVKDYVRGQELDVDELGDESLDLKIDQHKYYAFKMDLVDQLTMGDDVPKLKGNAEQQYANKMDLVYHSYLLNLAFTNAGSMLGTAEAPIVLDKDTVYDYIVDMGTILSNNNVPVEGRYIYASPEIVGWLKKDTRFSHSSELAKQVMIKGAIGEIDGAIVIQTNLVPKFKSTDNSKESKGLIIGHELCGASSRNLTGLKQYDPGRLGFGDEFKDLQIYGGKVVDNSLLVGAYIQTKTN